MQCDETEQERQRIFARLAVLQRLRDEMRAGNRAAVLKSIEQLIEAERAALEGRAPPSIPELATAESSRDTARFS